MSHDHICHYGNIRSLFSSPSSSHRGSQEKHAAEDDWLQRQRGGRRKEEAEVCQELEAAGNSVEGAYTGHVYLPVHPAAVLSPQLCLEAAPGLTGTDYSDSPCYTESWGPGVWERHVILPQFSDCPQCGTGRKSLHNLHHPQNLEDGVVVVVFHQVTTHRCGPASLGWSPGLSRWWSPLLLLVLGGSALSSVPRCPFSEVLTPTWGVKVRPGNAFAPDFPKTGRSLSDVSGWGVCKTSPSSSDCLSQATFDVIRYWKKSSPGIENWAEGLTCQAQQQLNAPPVCWMNSNGV